MAGSDRDSLDVEDGRDVVRVHVAEAERNHAASAGDIAQPKGVEALHVTQGLERILGEICLVLSDLVHANTVQIIDRDPQADGPGHVRRASLELERDVVPLRRPEVDLTNHLAPAHEGLHLLQAVLLAVQDPDARWPEHLVAAEGEEVTIDLLDIDRHVGNALRRIDDADRTNLVRALRDLLDRIDRAEDVRAVRDGNDLRPLRDQLVVIFHPQGAVVRHPRPLQFHALVILDEEPRHVVRVVLHHG